MRQLQHQIQPTWNSCASTCVAMLLGRPVQDVVNELHDAYMADVCALPHYLHRHGVKFKPAVSDGGAPDGYVENRIEFGHLYLLTVPSLNMDATLHFILLDARDDKAVATLDPNMGREGKRYYINWFDEPTGPEQIRLDGGYSVFFRIESCPATTELERAA